MEEKYLRSDYLSVNVFKTLDFLNGFVSLCFLFDNVLEGAFV